MVEETGKDWTEVVQGVLFAIRASPAKSTGFTPHQVLFGREVCFPSEKRVDKLVEGQDLEEFVEQNSQRLQNIQRHARQYLHGRMRKERAVHRHSKKKWKFIVGSKVFRVNRGPTARKVPRSGPFIITEVRGHGVFRIVKEGRGTGRESFLVNGRDIVPVFERNKPQCRLGPESEVSCEDSTGTCTEDTEAQEDSEFTEEGGGTETQ